MPNLMRNGDLQVMSSEIEVQAAEEGVAAQQDGPGRMLTRPANSPPTKHITEVFINYCIMTVKYLIEKKDGMIQIEFKLNKKKGQIQIRETTKFFIERYLSPSNDADYICLSVL